MDPNTPQLDRLEASVLRVESKLDTFAERLVSVEKDQGWLKATTKYAAVVLLAILGKLAHLTFFTPDP